jgi:hypothetical protein
VCHSIIQASVKCQGRGSELNEAPTALQVGCSLGSVCRDPPQRLGPFCDEVVALSLASSSWYASEDV